MRRPTNPAEGDAVMLERRIDLRLLLLGILAGLAVVWTLRAASWIFMPLMAAFFLALAVWPVCQWVQDHVSRRLGWLGYMAAMLLLLAGIGVFIGSLWFVGQQVAPDLPRYMEVLARLQDQARSWAHDLAGPLAGQVVGSDVGGQAVQDQLFQLAMTVAASAWQAVSMVVIILFLTLLMLVEAPLWSTKLADREGDARRREWLDTLATIGQRFRQFLVVSSILGIITGVLYVGWLSLFGIELVLLWGLLAFLLNYIPMIGSLVAGALPVLMAVVQKDLATAAAVAGGLMVIEQVMGNYVAPRFQGKQLSISPLVIMAALLLWGWMWGMAGAVLATPITVLMAIVLDQFPRLKPAAMLLGNQPDLDRFEKSMRS